mmetsp:Transcript_6598/g.18485  ORF Transcript_6598/g.18485 Transcript_6598/m.18485 type:complete len:374 (-) Transcript_6598:1455-2576(-)
MPSENRHWESHPPTTTTSNGTNDVKAPQTRTQDYREKFVLATTRARSVATDAGADPPERIVNSTLPVDTVETGDDDDWAFQSMVLEYEVCSLLRRTDRHELSLEEFRQAYGELFGSPIPMKRTALNLLEILGSSAEKKAIYETLQAVAKTPGSGYRLELRGYELENVWLVLCMDPTEPEDGQLNDSCPKTRPKRVHFTPSEEASIDQAGQVKPSKKDKRSHMLCSSCQMTKPCGEFSRKERQKAPLDTTTTTGGFVCKECRRAARRAKPSKRKLCSCCRRQLSADHFSRKEFRKAPSDEPVCNKCQPHDAQGDLAAAPPQRCSSCQRTLPRDRFTRTEYRKAPHGCVCNACRRRIRQSAQVVTVVDGTEAYTT